MSNSYTRSRSLRKSSIIDTRWRKLADDQLIIRTAEFSIMAVVVVVEVVVAAKVVVAAVVVDMDEVTVETGIIYLVPNISRQNGGTP